MGEWFEKVDVVGLDDLTKSMRELIKKYPEYFVPLEEGSRSAGELPVS